jgi:2-polyprenyl-3-methyl-5-hydroxy-6-metoxy-1,4-benzoquinol methylase
MTDENSPSKYEQQLDELRQIWNAEAESFDNEPDHGLRDPRTRAAWTYLLKTSLPPTKTEILDIGCGTGSLSLVLAGLGYTVTGIDLSSEMIARAQAKALASGHSIAFHVMDAAFPQFPPQQFDGIVCRHLLWTLPDMDRVLERWVRLLKPGGRLILIEGFWHTNAGLHAQDILNVLPASLVNISHQSLSDQADLWGHTVNDERYIITADLQS